MTRAATRAATRVATRAGTRAETGAATRGGTALAGPRGFTLVEVMVALVVVALAVPALLFTLDQHIDGSAYLRDRTLAQIVASNRLTELRLALRRGRGSLRGSLAGSEAMAGRDWFWRAQSTPTAVPDFSRLEIQVRDRETDNAPPLYTLVAFVKSDGAG